MPGLQNSATANAFLRWRTGLTGVLLGVIMATGQAPLGWTWLALGALATAIGFVCAASAAKPATWRGWVVGFGYFASSLFWIVEPFMVDVARHGWMAPFALVFLAGGLALFWGAAGAAARWGPLALVAAWALAELARGYVLTGFPWALIGYIWLDQPQAQLVSLIGPFGLTLLTLLAAAIPALLGRKRALVGAVWTLSIVAVMGLFGILRVPYVDPSDDTAQITVRLLQPNAPQHQKWDPEHIPVFLRRQMQMTRDAPLSVDVIVWPETALPYLLENAEGPLQAISKAATARPVVAGITRWMEDGSARNAAVVIGDEGRVDAIYDKFHLVPFGEYIPFASLLNDFGLYGLAEAAGGYSPGPGAQVLDLGPLGKVLPLICYEAIFPQDLRAAPERADWVLQLTNDAWFGSLAGPQQHLAQARFRAIEQGLPVLRSANTGVSAGIDPYGRVIAALPLNTAGALDVIVPQALPPTPYARWGDGPMLGIIVLLLIGAVVRSRQKPVELPRSAP